MRIGLFTDTYPPFINGVSTSIVLLERALKKQGHQVFIVTVNPENMSYKYENYDHIIRIPGIPIGIYDYRLTGIYPIRAINKIKKWNLDIIHSHTEFGIGTFARIIAKQLDIPLVHTYHTMYEDYVHYITKGHFDKSSKKVVEHLTKFYCDKTARELIVPSKKTYDLFKQKYKYERNIHIVPTGIDVERFYKEHLNHDEILALKKELGLKPEDFIILYVGRLAKEKSVEVLLESHVFITKKYPNCKLMIVGSGPDYEHFIQMSEELGIASSVIFTNAIPWEDIPSYYGLADLFVTASKTETQGLTVVEAMAASLPVVVFDDESFKEVVKDGYNGRLFKTKHQYQTCVEELIRDKEKLHDMSVQARLTASANSSKHYAEQILGVYKQALENKRNEKKFIDKVKDVVKHGFDDNS